MAEREISVICVNDGTSSPSIAEARRDGWAVYSPTPQQEAEGYCNGMCPGCNEDAFASGAYV